jgi:TPR repeat protein
MRTKEKIMKRILSMLVWVLMFSVVSVGPVFLAQAKPLDDALVAYDAEDYSKALKLFKPLAEQGDAQAQVKLGRMYLHSRGVAEDFKEAAQWFHKAAEQGHAGGQLELGGMYNMGRGVEKNSVEAYKWGSLSADQYWNDGNWPLWLLGSFTNLLNGFGLPDDQKKEADEWIKNWKPKKIGQGTSTGSLQGGKI